MKPLSEHLVALICTAEEMIRASTEGRAQLQSGFAEVAAAVRQAHKSPAEDTRATYAGVTILDAIEAFAYSGDDRWQMAIGCLLPILKADAWTALNNEKDARLRQ